MTDPREILGRPETLGRIDAALTRRAGRHRGWALVDARSAELPSLLVHVRPWLQDPEGEDGFRIGTRLRPFSVSEVLTGYGVVFLTGPGGAMEVAGYDSVAEALERDLPQLVLRVDGENLSYSDSTGRWLELPPPRAVVTIPLDLEIHGSRGVRLETTLPFSIEVASADSLDFVHLRLVEKNGFRETDFKFRMSTAGGVPLGRGMLKVDFDPDGPADRLVVAPEGFVPAIVVSPQPGPRSGRGRRFSRGVPVRLHLLFDRTTLDLEHWERAFEALLVPQEEDYNNAEDPKSKWNLAIRSALAQALTHRLPEFHEALKIELWWFADVAQAGVAEPDALPKSRTPWGHPGECAVENLADRLTGRIFGYATGMDLFDAVDDLLAQVVAATSFAKEQPAILIVGDSPPPPADERDPIWQELLERPLRTNARRSNVFRQELAELARRQVPVGWLFVRSSAPPAGRDLFLTHYAPYQTLRERALVALQRTPGLLVQSCDGASDLERGLAELLRRMAVKSEPSSHLEIGELR